MTILFINKTNNKLIVLILLLFFTISSCNKDDKLQIVVNQNLIESIKTDLDGYKIAFGDTRKIYMMNPDGTEIEELADGNPISGYVSWSPDAKYVYYASAKGPSETAWEAWRVEVTTKEAVKISNFGNDVRSLGVSPDGEILAISVMTGNSNIGDNNDNLTQFSTNLYTVPMSLVESKLNAGNQIEMSDLTAIRSSANSEQFWYEELNWNHDENNPVLAYTKTWRYDEDDVSYTHTYTIKADGTENRLVIENNDQPIWSFDNTKLSFLGLEYYDFEEEDLKNITITGFGDAELAGGSFSPGGGEYMVFEIGDENRKAGVAKTSETTNSGSQLPTNIDVYEPRWSPKKINN